MIKIWNYTIIFIIVILMFNMVYGIPVYRYTILFQDAMSLCPYTVSKSS